MFVLLWRLFCEIFHPAKKVREDFFRTPMILATIDNIPGINNNEASTWKVYRPSRFLRMLLPACSLISSHLSPFLCIFHFPIINAVQRQRNDVDPYGPHSSATILISYRKNGEKQTTRRGIIFEGLSALLIWDCKKFGCQAIGLQRRSLIGPLCPSMLLWHD